MTQVLEKIIVVSAVHPSGCFRRCILFQFERPNSLDLRGAYTGAAGVFMHPDYSQALHFGLNDLVRLPLEPKNDVRYPKHSPFISDQGFLDSHRNVPSFSQTVTIKILMRTLDYGRGELIFFVNAFHC